MSAICQYCFRPCAESDLKKYMCPLCRALYRRESDATIRHNSLNRLHDLLRKDIDLLTDELSRLAGRMHKREVAQSYDLKDYNEILAQKQGELQEVERLLGRPRIRIASVGAPQLASVEPPIVRRVVSRPLDKRLTRLQAIKLFCLDCSAGTAKERRECAFDGTKDTLCPLHPFRLGRRVKGLSPKASILAYCQKWCMNGSQSAVTGCDIVTCSLFPYRIRRLTAFSRSRRKGLPVTLKSVQE